MLDIKTRITQKNVILALKILFQANKVRQQMINYLAFVHSKALGYICFSSMHLYNEVS